MIIENGVLKELEYNDDISSIDWSSIKEIDSGVFSYTNSLYSLEIPDGVTKIGKRAFRSCPNLKSIKLPKGLTKIEPRTFEYCTELKELEIPSSVTEIGESAFRGCKRISKITFPNIELYDDIIDFYLFDYIYLAKDGKTISFSKEVVPELEKTCYCIDIGKENNFDKYEMFIKYNYRNNYLNLKLMKESGEIAFIPPDYVLEIFPSGQINNFFINGNDKVWGRLVKYLNFDELTTKQKNVYLPSLMKIYYALGGFSGNQEERDKALKYIVNYVASKQGQNFTPTKLGEQLDNDFSEIKLTGPYNKEFARFFMKYYKNNPKFMEFDFSDRIPTENEKKNYIALAHNMFTLIQKYFPYMESKGNSKRDLITPSFIAEHLFIKEYSNVLIGNEYLAELIGKYGYSQEQFDKIQNIFETAKKSKDAYVITADKAKEDSCVTYRLLAKDDPLGFVIGNITNCCQVIGRNGGTCVEDGYINPNAGFMVFEQTILDKEGVPTGEKRIIGQAYVWYDPVTKTICYDNIEIPKVVLKELESKNNALTTETLMKAVEESAEAIMQSMNKDGIMVEQVTTGSGYNDLVEILKERYKVEIEPKAKNRGYYGYTDAYSKQFVISTYKDITEKYATETRSLIAESLKDLKAIKLTSETQKVQ